MERNFSGKGGTFVFMRGAVQMQTAETCISFGRQHCCETNQLEGDSKYCKQKKNPNLSHRKSLHSSENQDIT